MAWTQQDEEEFNQLQEELGIGPSALMPSTQPKPVLEQVGTALKEQAVPLAGAAGGIVAGVLTKSPAVGLRAQSGIEAALAAQATRTALGSGIGAGLAEGTMQAIEDRPSFAGLGEAVIKEAAYDAAGNIVFNLGGRVIRFTADQVRSAFGSLSTAPVNPADAANQLLKKFGGGLTTFQRTGSESAGLGESLGRTALTSKGIFKKFDEANEAAIQSAKEEVLDTASNTAYEAIKTGENIAKAVQRGEAALKAQVNPFYAALDAAGGPKVDIVPLKRTAEYMLKSKAISGAFDEGEKKLLNDIANFGSAVSGQGKVTGVNFSIAQDTLSRFKSKLRDLQRADEPNTELVATLSKFVSNIENQMAKAAKSSNAPAINFANRSAKEQSSTLYDQYRYYSTLYRDSLGDLYNNTTAKLLVKDPEKLGQTIFASGNVTAFKESVQAIARAKKLNPNMNVKDTISQVRRGYIENLLKSEGGYPKLLERLNNDEALRRTFKTVLTKDQQAAVRGLLEASQAAARRPGQEVPLFLVGQQAAALASLGGGITFAFSPEARQKAADSPFATTVAAGGVGAILLGPRVLAKFATDPAASASFKELIKGIGRTSVMTANAWAKMTRLFEQVGVIPSDLSGQQAAAQAAIPERTEAEEAEFRRLQSELFPGMR